MEILRYAVLKSVDSPLGEVNKIHDSFTEAEGIAKSIDGIVIEITFEFADSEMVSDFTVDKGKE